MAGTGDWPYGVHLPQSRPGLGKIMPAFLDKEPTILGLTWEPWVAFHLGHQSPQPCHYRLGTLWGAAQVPVCPFYGWESCSRPEPSSLTEAKVRVAHLMSSARSLCASCLLNLWGS
jgi:hypothetical protein